MLAGTSFLNYRPSSSGAARPKRGAACLSADEKSLEAHGVAFNDAFAAGWKEPRDSSARSATGSSHPQWSLSDVKAQRRAATVILNFSQFLASRELQLWGNSATRSICQVGLPRGNDPREILESVHATDCCTQLSMYHDADQCCGLNNAHLLSDDSVCDWFPLTSLSVSFLSTPPLSLFSVMHAA